MSKKSPQRRSFPALQVPQWHDEWNYVTWDDKSLRRKPEPEFYLLSIPASELKALCGINRRSTHGRKKGSHDLGIQRRHEEKRSQEIAQFVQFGYPWSNLSAAKRKSGEFNDLRKPGWLPTAVVVNVLGANDTRRGKRVGKDDLIEIEVKDGAAALLFPKSFSDGSWEPEDLPPLEVIDGQHRLWAFEDAALGKSFNLPVVAFRGLDLSWQAYLFYTINIKPKKINASLAFDLYPLLRTEDWLERFEGHIIYREARAQELVDILWSHPKSPWHKRINMLGETGAKGRMVSQAAWVRTLLASFVKRWESTRSKIGGLFGAPVGSDEQTLPWSLPEQAAFLIHAGVELQKAIAETKEDWAKALRKAKAPELFSESRDLAFDGPNTLLNQDQGIRAFWHTMNDLCYIRADKLKLADWQVEFGDGEVEEHVSRAVKELALQPVGKFVGEVCSALATYDWRASDAPGLSEGERMVKAAFRGSGGYRELRRQVLIHLSKLRKDVGVAADDVFKALGY